MSEETQIETHAPRPPAFQKSRRPVNLRRSRPSPAFPGAGGTRAVGGDMVHSMKRRGLRPSQWVEYRPWILGAVALILLCVLNAAWLQRINRRIAAQGGWMPLVVSARRAIAGWVGGLAARIDAPALMDATQTQTQKHDEV